MQEKIFGTFCCLRNRLEIINFEFKASIILYILKIHESWFLKMKFYKFTCGTDNP